ncbi:peptidoglycan-binding domain-containing protein [Acidiferrobacter sp.]|uniref:peptidoglycan-binding domain-containing protein n=1 Tax=Acidiferrobacter sp. TaxID=1872107 RepID=UPI00263441A9|nr:peptidoglycan-binding domain-containing protein [Acidiferrobacter sp.]
MSRLRFRGFTHRTLLGVVLAAALPAAAFGQVGGTPSSSQTGAASGHSMMGQPGTGAPRTTGAGAMTGSAHKPGSSPRIKSLQSALNRKEHAHLAVDGKMGPETRAALEKFQKAHGLKPTGHPDKATEKDLGL